MTDPEKIRFGQLALQTGLVNADQLRACWDQIPTDKRTPDAIDRRLARRLVDSGHLTRWQAQQLMAGIKPQGLHFGKYVVEDLIGQGGMGRVYLARDTRLRRRVALKVLSRERTNNPRALARFRREAKVGAQLQHDNLVRIYDEGEVNGLLYLVMEYIEGKNVGQLILERGPLPPPLAARIAAQVALGLEHASAKGLIHRDVNPMNILVDREGTAKLTDLGLAIELGEQGDAVTREGATVGTFDYISPEQARHSRSIDARSDIYSLGCSLYHMITGRVPFPQPSLPEKLYAHQMLDPPPLSGIVPEMPPGFEAVIRRMMAKRPEDRFGRPCQVAEALEPFQGAAVRLAEIEAAPERPLWLDSLPAPDAPKVEPGTPGAITTPATPDPEPIPPTPASNSPDGLAPDPFPAFPMIDTGPAEPLSLSRGSSGSRSREREREPERPRQSASEEAETTPTDRSRLWIGVGGGVLALLIAGFFLLRGPLGGGSVASSPTTTSTSDSADAPPETDPKQSAEEGTKATETPIPTSGIAVRWLDSGTVEPVADLSDAISRAVGKNAEVVLSNAEPLEIPPETSLVVSGGPLVIRSEPGTRRSIRARRADETPAFQVYPNASLTLVNVSMELVSDRTGTPPLAPANLIQAFGDLSLEGCRLTASGTDRFVRAASAEGGRSTFTNCDFRGFADPLQVVAVIGSQVRLSNCLMICQRPGDQASGWAISLTPSPLGLKTGERSLVLDRCTVLAAGLLSLEDIGPAMPLKVEATRCAVQAQALVAWRGATPFPQGLTWQGSKNRYDLPATPWALVAPNGTTGVPGGPSTLDAWRQAGMAEADSESTPLVFPFASTDPVLDRPPAEFAIEGDPETRPGIDPELLTP